MMRYNPPNNRFLPHLLMLVLLASLLSPLAFTNSVKANGPESASSFAQAVPSEGPGTDNPGKGLGPRNDPPAPAPIRKGESPASIPGIRQLFYKDFGHVTGLNKGLQTGPSQSKAAEYLSKRPLSFIENRGQTHPSVRYEVRAQTHTVFFTPREVVFAAVPRNDAKVRGEALRIKFAGASTSPIVTGLDRLNANYNFFSGNNPANWKTDVPTYSSIAYKGLYKGVDLIYRDSNGKIERDFVIAPGVEPSLIKMRYDGAKKIRVGEQGELVVETELSVLTESKPIAYQEVDGKRIEVAARFKVGNDGSVGFAVDRYDATAPLVIDPIFGFSTYIGGNGVDQTTRLAVDATGIYVTGETRSVNFPVTNTFGTRAGSDSFALKLSPDGSTLIYGAILAGSGSDLGIDVEVHPTDRTLYIFGHTESTNFPTTAGAFDTTFNGASDYTVTRLNAAGNGLVWSTYIGGSGSEESQGGIDLYNNGDCWIVGASDSSGATYPVAITFGTNLSPTNSGGLDGVATVILNTGAMVITSGFWGGTNDDRGTGVKIDRTTLDFYYSGTTTSANAPVCTGVGAPFTSCLAAGFDTTYNGNFDGHVTRFTNTARPRGSTFIGSPVGDETNAIDIDNATNIYVAGATEGPTYPTTPGAFDTTFNGDLDEVVTKFNPTLSALGYSTFIGGSRFDQAQGIAVSGAGEAYVAGVTDSVDYPAPLSSLNGSIDVAVSKLNASGNALTYAAYIGGSSADSPLDIRLNSANLVTVSGFTFSQNFPTTPGAFDATLGGNVDGFVTQVNTSFTSCLRQDGDPTVFFFNALTGQYRLCGPFGIDFTGTATVSTNGCALTLSDANTFMQINLCNRTGYASVFVPNKAFVILVDQNIDDNVCVCAP